jgi:hypothetical protein
LNQFESLLFENLCAGVQEHHEAVGILGGGHGDGIYVDKASASKEANKISSLCLVWTLPMLLLSRPFSWTSAYIFRYEDYCTNTRVSSNLKAWPKIPLDGAVGGGGNS